MKVLFEHPTHKPSEIRPGIVVGDLPRELENAPGVEVGIDQTVEIGDALLKFERSTDGYIGVNVVDENGNVIQRGEVSEFVPRASFTEKPRLSQLRNTALLVLTRKKLESIRIKTNLGEIIITVADISGNKVRLSVKAPGGLTVNRREISNGNFSFVKLAEVNGNRVRLGIEFDPIYRVDRIEGVEPRGLTLTRRPDEDIVFPQFPL